ncbi:hypothetical protein IJ732_00865 [bacterium]|nr:hypothetical protein [bacterium]
MNVNGIGKVVNTVATGAGKVLDKTAQLKPIQKGMELAKKDPAKFATNMLLFSIVSKDAVGCYLYTTQSLNNKKIPEEKRKFVASMDLMNGILMVGGQTIVGKILVDKVIAPKIKEHYTKNVLSDTNITKKVVDSIARNADKLKEMGVDGSKLDVQSIAGTVSKTTKAPFIKGLGILTTAIATTALIKRTIVPLLSTPLAGKMTEVMDKKNAEKSQKAA